MRAFYAEVIGKMLKAFPLQSQLLKDLKVLDPVSCLDISPETGKKYHFIVGISIQYFQVT